VLLLSVSEGKSQILSDNSEERSFGAWHSNNTVLKGHSDRNSMGLETPPGRSLLSHCKEWILFRGGLRYFNNNNRKTLKHPKKFLRKFIHTSINLTLVPLILIHRNFLKTLF
jgi:hypothetical protein